MRVATMLLAVLFFAQFAVGQEGTPRPVAEQTELTELSGVYVGPVYGGGSTTATVLYMENDKLLGVYFMHFDYGTFQGELRDIEINPERVLTATWSDMFGTGSLRVRFTEDLSSFKGVWAQSTAELDQSTFHWEGAEL